jgi:4'-phosphopantetheinyl transferase
MQYICIMPMVQQFQCDNYSFGLWKIEEEPIFFKDRIAFVPAAAHPEKQLQQLASRMVLDAVHPQFPFDQVVCSASGKPAFIASDLHFSLSHCSGFAAGIVSKTCPVGIDVEPISERVLKVEKKFLNQHELQWLEGVDPQQRMVYSTLLWSIKETVFKWWGQGGLDFSKHMVVHPMDISNPGWSRVDFLLLGERTVQVEYLRFENVWLSVLHTA